MEVNRDEAERCYEIAEKYLRLGNRYRAKKLLEKSIRLFPLKKASGKYKITVETSIFVQKTNLA